MPIYSPVASPVVLCRKNNGKSSDDLEEWEFALEYRKLNDFTEHPQFSIQVRDKNLATITSTNFMFNLDLTSS